MPRDATVRVAVDARNPGQVFACCGLLEVADRLWGGAEGWFVPGAFQIAPIDSGGGSLRDLLDAIIKAPFEECLSIRQITVGPLIAPLRVELGTEQQNWLWLDFWVEVRADKQTVVAAGTPWQQWSGQQTPKRIWGGLRGFLVEQLGRLSDPLPETFFSDRRLAKGRFGFDPGPAWNALDAGFSPNEQGMEVASSPAVEMLAAVGLQRFRPALDRGRDAFTYALWPSRLTPACAAVVSAVAPNRYRGRFVARGNYGALSYAIPLTGAADE